MMKAICYKKIVQLCILVASMFAAVKVNAEVTIWIKSASAPYVYAWSDDGSPIFGEYPGKKLTVSNDGWWLCYLSNRTSMNIAINDKNVGSAHQTADILGVTGTRFFVYNGANFYLDVTQAKDAAAYAFLEPTTGEGWAQDGARFAVDGTELQACGGYNSGPTTYLWTSETELADGSDITFERKSSDLSATWNSFTCAYHKGGYYQNDGWTEGKEVSMQYRNIAFPTGIVFSYENFPDSNFRTYLKGNSATKAYFKDLNTGDIILPSSLSGITSLSGMPKYTAPESQKIRNLKGIEYFKNLEYLNCSGQAQQSFAHKLEKLTFLQIGNNYKLTNLDLSGLPNIEIIQCYNPHSLVSLDVSMCKKLKHLDLNGYTGRALTHIYLGDIDQLTSLDLTWQYITELDISKQVQLGDLHLNVTKLTCLDLSNNPNIGGPYVGVNVYGEVKNFSEGKFLCNCSRDLQAETGVTKGGKRFYYFRLDDLSAGPDERSIVERMTETSWNRQTVSEFDPSRATWTSGVAGIVNGALRSASISEIDADLVVGKILILQPKSETDSKVTGSVVYSYDWQKPGTPPPYETDNGFTLNWTADPKVITAIVDIEMDEPASVMNTTYYNVSGMASSKPWPGLNIVVTHDSDGTTTTSKVIF